MTYSNYLPSPYSILRIYSICSQEFLPYFIKKNFDVKSSLQNNGDEIVIEDIQDIIMNSAKKKSPRKENINNKKEPIFLNP